MEWAERNPTGKAALVDVLCAGSSGSQLYLGECVPNPLSWAASAPKAGKTLRPRPSCSFSFSPNFRGDRASWSVVDMA